MTNSPFNLPLARYYGEEMVESVLEGPSRNVTQDDLQRRFLRQQHWNEIMERGNAVIR